MPLEPGCPTGRELQQLFRSSSMLGPAVAKLLSTWTPVRGDAPSPLLPTLVTQVLSSFPPLLQLLLSYATVERQIRSATDSVLLLTRQLSRLQILPLQLPFPPLPKLFLPLPLLQQQQLLPLIQWRLSPQLLHQLLPSLPLHQ